MFNLFKSKRSLIPSDLNKGLLTSNFCTFKVGDKLTIPDNSVCLVRYKDKTYKELTTDTYSLNKEFLLDLYTKQLKGKKKLKELDADLYFINLASFSYEFEYLDKLPLNNIKSKILFNVSFSVKVEDIENFSDYIIYENTAATSLDTQNLIINYAESCVKRFYLKRRLENIFVSAETTQALLEYMQKYFLKIGLNVSNLTLTLYKKSDKGIKQEEQKSSNFFNIPTINEKKEVVSEQNTNNTTSSEENTNTENLVGQPTEKNYTEKEANNNICPNCKSKTIPGSIYCHKCGYRK